MILALSLRNDLVAQLNRFPSCSTHRRMAAMELTCLRIELFEEGGIHRCDLAMTNACEAPAVGAEAG